MGTLGCINDMLQRDKENRELRRINRERLTEIRNRLMDVRKNTDYSNLTLEKMKDIRQKTLEKEASDKAYIHRITFYLIISAALLILLLWLLTGCSSKHIAHPRENGWYHVLDNRIDSLFLKPIVTSKDFAVLRLDSDAFGKQVIVGQVHPYYIDRWAAETEKAIGRQIAFVFNDSVICNPCVNMKLESGNFAITSSCDTKLLEIYEKLNGDIDLSYQDSLTNLVITHLHQEAADFQKTLTDTTFLKTRGMMSYAAIDFLNGRGFNRDAAYNQTVYLAALDRARRKLTVKSGHVLFPCKSNQELNISIDIFLFIQSLFKEWNQHLNTGKYKLLKDEKGLYTIVPQPISAN